MEEQKLLNIFKEIKEHENSMKSLNKNNIVYKGYLIDDELMKELKNKIQYEELKNHFQDESYMSNILKSEKLANAKRINFNFINQSKFKNNQELEKALNANKKYWIINFSLWKLICIKEKENDKGISYSFKDNQIILKLNENEKISFRKNNCIIDKSSIINYTVLNKQNDLVPKKEEEVQINKKGETFRNDKLNIKQNPQIFNTKEIKNEIHNIRPSKTLINTYDIIDYSKLDSLSCINCKSEIEIESIDFNFENNDNSIAFECNGNCGKINISIKDFLIKFIKNTYLYEKCTLCKKKQIDYYQKNNFFIYCIDCKNIFCNECKEKNKNNCKHENYILAKEIKNTCLIHNNYFCCYCIDDKKQLCGECLIQDCHMKCKKVEMNKISSPIISDKEIEIFNYLLQTFQNLKNSIINCHDNESNIETFYNNRKKDLLSQYEEKCAKEEKEESSQIKIINKNDAGAYKNYFEELKNLSYDIVEEITSSLHILEEEEEKNNMNKNYNTCVKIKYESFDKFFNELDNIKNNYKNKLEKIKNKYKKNEELIKQEKEKYKKIKDDIKQKYDADLNEINIEYKNEIEKRQKEIEKIKDNYENQIKIGKIIFNSYKECKFNYFNAKNMYNLITNYYKNKNIYENIIIKYLNNRNDKDLSLLIKQKAETTFENFIDNNKNIYILKNIKFPPLIGLKNVNSFCFMNSILQCFSHITLFVEFFKNNNQVLTIIERNKNNNNLILSSSFKYLIDNLWLSANDFTKNKQVIDKGSNKYFCPYNIKDKIEKMNALLSSRNINTMKDLFIFIILTLHEELNRDMTLNSKIFEANIKTDEKNENIMRNNFINTFKRENISLISDLFYAMKEITFCCNNCNTFKYNFKKYFYLDFHLNSILNFKTKNQNSARNNFTFDNTITIYDCFDYEIRIASTNIYCDICQKLAHSFYKVNFSFLPEILVIFINRLEGFNSKIKFQFYEKLYLEKYIQFKDVGFCYNLIGVVAAYDNYLMEKHFFAFCKSPIDSKWYKYDDDKVSHIVDTNQEILNNNIPYILFYQNAKSNN